MFSKFRMGILVNKWLFAPGIFRSILNRISLSLSLPGKIAGNKKAPRGGVGLSEIHMWSHLDPRISSVSLYLRYSFPSFGVSERLFYLILIFSGIL